MKWSESSQTKEVTNTPPAHSVFLVPALFSFLCVLTSLYMFFLSSFSFLLLVSSKADPHVASASPEAPNCQHSSYEMTQR